MPTTGIEPAASSISGPSDSGLRKAHDAEEMTPPDFLRSFHRKLVAGLKLYGFAADDCAAGIDQMSAARLKVGLKKFTMANESVAARRKELAKIIAAVYLPEDTTSPRAETE